MELTLAPCATPSISTKWTFGNSLATFCTAWVWAKPIDAIRSRFLRANARRTCSAWVSLEACTSIKPMPVSFLKRVAPSKADWLNDLSNLPPASYTMPSFGSAADALAATNSAAIVKLNCLSFMNRLLEDRYCIFLLGQTCNLTARKGQHPRFQQARPETRSVCLLSGKISQHRGHTKSCCDTSNKRVLVVPSVT